VESSHEEVYNKDELAENKIHIRWGDSVEQVGRSL
jgi:hypothetical protein